MRNRMMIIASFVSVATSAFGAGVALGSYLQQKADESRYNAFEVLTERDPALSKYFEIRCPNDSAAVFDTSTGHAYCAVRP